MVDEAGEPVDSVSIPPHFQDDVKAMFTASPSFTGNPLGLDVAGKVKRLGAPTSKGKQKTLAKGKLYATIARDADGALALAGVGKGVVSASSVLSAGVPIDDE